MKANHLTARKNVGEKIFVYLPIVLFVVLCFLPFWLILASSFTDNEVLLKGIVIWPKEFTFEGYRIIFAYPLDMLKSYGITILVTVGGLIISVLLSVLIAYPLSDMEFRHRKWISFLLFFTILFSAGLIPTYIIIARIYHLDNTLFVLMLMPALVPGHVIMLRVFFQGVPASLYESAKLDGAGEYTILFRISIPLILPGLATVAFQIVIMYWNDSFTSLYYADDITPIALYLYRWENYINYLKFAGQGGLGGIIGTGNDIPDLVMRYAMAIVTCMPLLIVFLFFQKYFVRGLTSGAVKG